MSSKNDIQRLFDLNFWAFQESLIVYSHIKLHIHVNGLKHRSPILLLKTKLYEKLPISDSTETPPKTNKPSMLKFEVDASNFLNDMYGNATSKLEQNLLLIPIPKVKIGVHKHALCSTCEYSYKLQHDKIKSLAEQQAPAH